MGGGGGKIGKENEVILDCVLEGKREIERDSERERKLDRERQTERDRDRQAETDRERRGIVTSTIYQIRFR